MGQCHSQPQAHASELPSEVVFSILQHLSPQEMKSAVLVCRSLREMGEEPRFWAWAVVSVNSRDDLHKLKRPRLQMVEEIDVTSSTNNNGTKDIADLFQGIHEMIPKIKRIRGLEFCEGIQGIAPDMAVSVLNSIEKLKLCDGPEYFYGQLEGIESGEDEDEGGMRLSLMPEQLELLFKAIAEKTSLKFLQVAGQDLDELEPTINPLFAAAVTNVEEVVLKEVSKGDITSEQYQAVYAMIATEDRPLRKLSMLSSYIDPIGYTDPDLLSKAFNRLEEVNTYGMCSGDQLTAILRGLVEGGSRLKSFKLHWNNRMGEMDLDLLCKALNNLEEFVTYGFGTGEQLTAILRGLLDGESRLKRLMFEHLHPKIIQDLDQNLVRRAEEKIGKFYTFYTTNF